MKKLIIAIAVMFLSLTVAQAQPYKAAVGLEGGFGGVGVTFKQFTGPSNFFDYKANLAFGKGYTSVMVSDTFDWNIPIAGGFQFYFGVGAGIGAYFAKSSAFTAGVFGNLGFEYAFNKIPFAISLDWNPGFYMTVANGFHGAFGWDHYMANLGI